MKKTIILSIAVALWLQTNAQKLSDKGVPTKVKSAFNTLYPKATEVKWEKENGEYEAHFTIQNIKQSVLINNAGQVTESETSIKTNELPIAAIKYVEKNYPKQKIKEAAKIINSKGVTTYEAEIKGKDIIFDATGSFIKETK